MVAIMTDKNKDYEEKKHKASTILVLGYENDESDVNENRSNCSPHARDDIATIPCLQKSTSASRATAALTSIKSSSFNPANSPAMKPPIFCDNIMNKCSSNDAFVFKTPEKPARRSKAQNKSPHNAQKATHHLNGVAVTSLPSSASSSSTLPKRHFSSTPCDASKRDTIAAPLALSPITNVEDHDSQPTGNHSKPLASKRRIIVEDHPGDPATIESTQPCAFASAGPFTSKPADVDIMTQASVFQTATTTTADDAAIPSFPPRLPTPDAIRASPEGSSRRSSTPDEGGNSILAAPVDTSRRREESPPSILPLGEETGMDEAAIPSTSAAVNEDKSSSSRQSSDVEFSARFESH